MARTDCAASWSISLFRFDEVIQNKGVKSATRGAEPPSHVQQASAANSDLPFISGKPGELICGQTGMATARCGSKASHMKNNAARIGKSVVMGIVNGNFFLSGGDIVAAMAASQKTGFLLFRFLVIFSELLRGSVRC